ncbi:MAG: tRNA pseudouridine(55) synthase TruB [Acidimicrobiia bacterium]|nr:tRNA pseudouridine(55) synthase TruB [Acidimicrobiia bacterium]
MTGVLLIDKPSGPTSHDVVARMRRVSGERSIGHAGTLDPRATGLLVLMLGKATRIATLLTGHDKAYDATIRFGFATTTDDAAGEPIKVSGWADGQLGGWGDGRVLSDDAIRTALDATVGPFEQLPPRYSAKMVDGQRAYDLARQDKPIDLKRASVALHGWEWLGREDDRLHIRVSVSAGFYVRSLARDLGEALGCPAHLDALRRTRSGPFDVTRALPLAEAERLGPEVEAHLVPMAEALSDLPAVRVSEAGLVNVRHGNPIGPQLIEGPWVPASDTLRKIRLLDESGALVALADLRGGLLQPSTVLG